MVFDLHLGEYNVVLGIQAKTFLIYFTTPNK